MALEYLGEIFDRPAEETQEQVSTNRVFRVRTTERESALLILGVSEIPVINSTHPDNSKLICTNRSANIESEHGDTWLVTLQYSPSSDSYSTPVGQEKPWNLPPYNISFSAISYNKVLALQYGPSDRQGVPEQPVLNSAGDPFDPPLETVKYNMLIKFSYNKRYFNTTLIKDFIGTINDSNQSVLGVPIASGHGRLNNFGAFKHDVTDSEGDVQYSYFQIDVEIELQETFFLTEVLDSGFNKLDGSDLVEIKLSDVDSNITAGSDEDKAITEPAKLNGSGGVLSPSGEPEYLFFAPYFSKQWATLGLPKRMERSNSRKLGLL